MVALKGTSDIGDRINKKIIFPLANANKLSDLPDFNDATKLGSGKEMVYLAEIERNATSKRVRTSGWKRPSPGVAICARRVACRVD